MDGFDIWVYIGLLCCVILSVCAYCKYLVGVLLIQHSKELNWICNFVLHSPLSLWGSWIWCYLWLTVCAPSRVQSCAYLQLSSSTIQHTHCGNEYQIVLVKPNRWYSDHLTFVSPLVYYCLYEYIGYIKVRLNTLLPLTCAHCKGFASV